MIVTGIALSLHFQHHLEISIGGMLREMESLGFVGLSKSIPLFFFVYCHSYPTFGVTFLPSNLRRPPGPSTQMTSPCPCLEQPSTWNLQLQEFFRSYGHQTAKGWLLGCNISGQEPNFWRSRQGLQYFNLVRWTNIDNVLSRLNHSQLFRTTWL